MGLNFRLEGEPEAGGIYSGPPLSFKPVKHYKRGNVFVPTPDKIKYKGEKKIEIVQMRKRICPDSR